MTEPTDEMLMAYVDGQLSNSDRKSIEAYLAANPSGRERLQAFIDTGPVLARALNAATAGPVPGWIVETVKRHRPLPARVESVKPVNRWWSFSARDQVSLWPIAAVACASLVVGFGIGRHLFQLAGASTGPLLVAADHQGGLVAAAPLQQMLETARSGAINALGPGVGGLQATPVLSFKSRQAGVCRQYRVSTTSAAAATGSSEGLACRQPDGKWRIEIHAVAAARQPSAGGMAPAAGPGSSPVDAVVDRIIDGDPLGADDERRLLDNRWQVDGPNGGVR